MASIQLKILPLAGVLLLSTTVASTVHAHGTEQLGSPEHNIENPEYHAVVVDSQGDPVVDARGNCVRSSALVSTDRCRVVEAVAVSTRDSITEEDRTVYFDFDKSNLRPDARERLHSLTKAMKADEQVKAAHIVGYADRIGSEEYNERLSQRRAATVKDYLVSQGIVNTDVTETRWVGENAPATRCESDQSRNELIRCLQRDRKVEVEIEYYPETERHVSR